MLNLRLLKSFLAVYRYGGITKASEKIFITQPSLTRQIQDLEDLVGKKLFERTKKGIVLTEAGELLQIRAQELIDFAERTEQELKEEDGVIGGIVRIGCVETSAGSELASVLKKWKEGLPEAQFEIYSADGDDIRCLLDEDKLDLGILVEPVESAKYDSVEMHVKDRWCVVMPEDHPLVKKKEVSFEELKEYPRIFPRRMIVIDTLSQWSSVLPKNVNQPLANH